MTRIIGGVARGRRLAVPTRGTRPTADRVREAMFSSIGSWLAADQRDWAEIGVLDLFAGTGALGLEAASRGARQVVLVERARSALETIRRNVVSTGLDVVTVVAESVSAVASRPNPFAPFDLCLADPPYDLKADAIGALLDQVDQGGWLAPDCLVVVERPEADHASPLPAGWQVQAHRRYGDSSLWYGQRQIG